MARVFPGLQESLAKAGLYLPADAYTSFMLTVAGIIGAFVALNVFLLAFALSKSLLLSAIVAVPTFVVSGTFGIAFTYVYPSIASRKKRRAIEEGLPYTVSFMGILSSSGVPPERIMRSLALLEKADVGLGGESTVMYRDMELMGGDLITVLNAESKKNLSPLLSGIMDGFVSTIRAGGSLGAYFQEEAKALMRLRRSILKEFVDVLVTISEMYMGLMVAFPLILIVMLVVLSSIGGGTVGGIGPETLVPIVVYGIIPLAGTIILLFLDAVSGRS